MSSKDIIPVENEKATEKDVVDDKTQEGDKDKDEAGWSSYRRIFAYTDRTGWILNFIAFIAAICSGALLPLMNLVFGKTITTFTDFGTGRISPDEFRSQTTSWTLWFIYLFLGKFCLTYIWTVALNISALRTTKSLRIDFLRQALRQDIAFFDQSSNGAIAIQITTNGNLVNVGIAEKLGLAVQGLATFVAAFAVAFAVQWKLTLITLSIVPTILIVVAICVGIEMRNEAKILDIYGRAGALAEEVFSSMRNVHAFWAHPRLAGKYDDLLLQARREGRVKRPNYGVLFSTEFFCVNAGYGLAFWQGIHMYASGEIAASGSVVTVIFAVIVAATALTQVAGQIISVTQAASAAHDLFKIIDRQSQEDSMSTAGHTPSHCKGELELRDLEFHYPSRPDAPILQGTTLKLPAGKTTALVGASGSGKSTVIGMIERWYKPTAGTVKLDGIELSQLNITWLRTNIRLVQQEPVLFNGTVFDNVSYGLVGTSYVNASKAEKLELVQEACKAAFAHDFISDLPEGYDTEVGERAGKLSGGQKQRIAIARSIISDPTVLLLDEATSALDPKAEKIVQEALDKVSKSRTTLIIAHKLSTVRKADNIAVMSKGVILEQGSHEQLIAKGGEYSRLVRAQDLQQKTEGDDTGVDQQNEEDKRPDLVRLKTTDTTATTDMVAEDTEMKGFNYSLPKCLWILGRQQPDLWPWFLLVATIAVLGGGVNPSVAVLFARAITAFQLPSDQAIDQGNFWALMLFVVAIVIFFVYFSLGWSTAVVSQETTYFYRLQMFKDIMNQDMDFFDREKNTTGALVSKLSTDPTNLQELLGFNVALIMTITVNVVASSILAIATGWMLGLAITLSALPVMVSFGYIRIRLEFKLEDQIGDRFSSSAALASEAVAAIRTVASLALESNVLQRYEDRLQGIEKRSAKSFLWTMVWFSISQSVNFLAMALGFWYGSRLLSTGEYDSTQFFTVFTCVIFSGEGAAQFFSYTTSFTKAQKAANYLLWLHSIEPKMREQISPGAPPTEKDNGGEGHAAEVNCADLTFSYPLRPQYRVLRGVSVDANPGQSLAFVGASGCGKTTMIALLERFYDPDSGMISFNNQNIKNLDPRRYRSNIALVQQEPTLYQGSIRDNVALGKEQTASNEEIEAVCRKANIFDFVTSLPEGLDTLVGNRGTQLSGGQRQRIAIARALIRQPKLLLLDEATSALDTESERLIQAALEETREGCTTIAVAHRLSTVRNCDCIFVFSRGKIAEAGTHSQLLDRKGIYHEMCLGQALDQA
ncbi:MAG: hypothetical protein M1821_006675 [Bathelium mastoideum]|nr:MAG: hypothetical protein M1821_006675 [Bathelium mastoideum]